MRAFRHGTRCCRPGHKVVAGRDAISEATLLAGLYDIRMPAAAAGGLTANIAVAVGLGLICAVAVSTVLVIFRRPNDRPAPPVDFADRIDRLRLLPDHERQVALLHLMRSAAPEAMPADPEALYRPGGLPAVTALEAELLRRVTDHA